MCGNFKLYVRGIFCVAILFINLGTLCAADERKNSRDKILYISSYSSDSYFVQDDMLSLVNHYNAQGGAYMQILESMNCQSLDESKDWQQIMINILKKHRQIKAVVLVGNEAVITYLSLSDARYKEIPVYILQCNNYLACLPTSSGISSVAAKKGGEYCRSITDMMKGFNVRYAELTEYQVRENMELIQRLYGHTSDIAILTDNSYSGLCMQYAVREEMRNHSKWKFHYIDGRFLNMQQALDAVQHLSLRTIMVLGCWGIDKDNVSYLSNAVYAFRQVHPLLPVFSFSGAGLGYWVIGGYIPQTPRQREELAKFFYSDLDENQKEDPRIYTLPSSFIFDETVLRAMEISKSELPDSSHYLNGEMGFKDLFQYYQWYVILGFCVVFLLLIVTLGAVIYSVRISRLRDHLLMSERSLKREKENLEISEHRLRVAKERAEEAGRAKINFVSNMSHEIRTPLNSIVGFSQVLSEVVKDQPELKEYADIIYHNSETLVKLIDGLLEISDIESGKIQFSYDNIDVVPLFEGIVDNLKSDAKEGVLMSFETSCSSVEVITDINRLLQVIMNLLQNACKFTEKGSIVLSVEKDPANIMALVSVTDTGVGIPKELQHMIFDRFEKVNEFVQGSGMGLTICQTIVEQQGGKIWIDMEYTGGARFVFTLPLVDKTL